MRLKPDQNPSGIASRAAIDVTDCRACPGPIRYEALTEFSQAEAISAEWDEVLEQSRCNRAFASSTWFLTTPALFPKLKPLVIVARRDGLLAGILPLVVDVRCGKAGFPNDFSDHHDIISHEEDIEVVTGLLDVLMSGPGPWPYDQLSLKSIRADSNILKGLRIIEHRTGRFESGEAQNSYLHGYVDLTLGYSEYVKTLSRNFRHNLNRVRNKAQRGEIVVREIGPDELAPTELPETFLTLHLSRIGEDTVFRPARSWLRKLLPALFAAGRLRVFAALSKERIVGLHLVMVGQDSLFGWNGGFLPQAESFAPGRLLYDAVFRQASLERLHEYDFGCWDGLAYKDDWKPKPRPVFELQFAAPPRALNLGTEAHSAAKARMRDCEGEPGPI